MARAFASENMRKRVFVQNKTSTWGQYFGRRAEVTFGPFPSTRTRDRESAVCLQEWKTISHSTRAHRQRPSSLYADANLLVLTGS